MRTLIALWLLSTALVAADAPAKIAVSVTDDKDKLLAGAQLRVFMWNGTWERTEISASTDGNGAAELGGIKSDQYLTVAIEAAGLAATTVDMELNPEERRELKVRLQKPASGTLRVLNDQGQPLVGAILSFISFKTQDGDAFTHRNGSVTPIPFEVTASDAAGIIKLPAMPQSAKLDLEIFHSDFLPNRLSGLINTQEQLAEVKLERGTALNFAFVPGGGLSRLPKDLPVKVSLNGLQKDRDKVPGLYLPMSLTSDNWHCQIVPAQYRWVYVRSESDKYTITPNYYNDDPNFKDQVNLVDSQAHKLEFMVRENQPVRGKVTGYLEGLEAGASASGSTENLHPSASIQFSDNRWASVSIPEIKPDGTFVLSLPPGRAKVSFLGLKGAIIEPAEFEFVIEPGKEVKLPEFKLRPLQNLTGQVVDEQQRPIASALARLYVGMWPTDYVKTDEAGKFSVSLDLIVHVTNHHHPDVPISLIAFDPKSNHSALVPLTKDWKKPGESLIVCEPHDANWLLDAIDEQAKRCSTLLKIPQQESARRAAENQIAFPAAGQGREAPELSGTWLNTTNNSLKEFRGKFVLLDFWFIGCGPCEADLPNVKMLQEVIGSERINVVSVHTQGQSPDNVRQFAEQKGMNYPIVVDNLEETEEAYKKLGVDSYPTYILLGRNGEIIYHDLVNTGPSLRSFKIERTLASMRR